MPGYCYTNMRGKRGSITVLINSHLPQAGKSFCTETKRIFHEYSCLYGQCQLAVKTSNSNSTNRVFPQNDNNEQDISKLNYVQRTKQSICRDTKDHIQSLAWSQSHR